MPRMILFLALVSISEIEAVAKVCPQRKAQDQTDSLLLEPQNKRDTTKSIKGKYFDIKSR